MRLKPFSWQTAVLLLIGTSSSASAQTQDTVTFTAGAAQLTDSNLFRLPASTDFITRIGKPSAEEHIGITSVGLNFNKAYSMQRVEFGLNLIDYKYQNFSYLSFTASNYNAAWRWALTPRFTGNLTTDRKVSLNSFADYTNTTVRNKRTNTNTQFDAAYELAGPWRVLAGMVQSDQKNDQPLSTGDDYSALSANTGLRYHFTSGSTLAYTLTRTNGSYLNRVLPSAGLYDDSFNQTDNTLKLHWLVTGQSTVDISAAHISRTHPNYAQRDYSGLNAGANLNWSLTGKTAIVSSWTHQLDSYQTNSSNYVQTDRLSLGPVWQVSPKTTVRLRQEIAKLDYLGNPTGLAVSQRSDTTRDTTLSLEWQPHQRLTLSASLQNSTRASNQANLDFESKQASLSAQFSY